MINVQAYVAEGCFTTSVQQEKRSVSDRMLALPDMLIPSDVKYLL